MKNYHIKVTTRRWNVASLVFCMIACLWLAATKFERIGRTPPTILFLFCLLALLTGWKTVFIGLDNMCIQYNLFLLKRTVSIERVRSVELVIKNSEHTLLISLDDCPSYKNEITANHDFYILKHPINVIAIRCSPEDALRCKAYFEANRIHTDIIIKNTYHQDLRDS